MVKFGLCSLRIVDDTFVVHQYRMHEQQSWYNFSKV